MPKTGKKSKKKNSTSIAASEIEATFADGGALAQVISHYVQRPEQVVLAKAIAEAFTQEDILVAEAGTGTGKTFAYLVPAVLSDKQTLIATGTKNLQDQLYYRDIPRVVKALKLPVKTALLKGRANYLCLQRLAHIDSETFPSRQIIHDIVAIRDQAITTRFGEISEINAVAQDSPVWPWVTSTAENCLYAECEFFSQCPVMKARRRAMEADLIVVNHHVLFADFLLRTQQEGELLPEINQIIIDEAHQIPALASQFFGKRFSSRQLHTVLEDCAMSVKNEAPDMAALSEQISDALTTLGQWQPLMSQLERKQDWQQLAKQPEIKQAVSQLIEVLDQLKMALQEASQRGTALKQSESQLAAVSSTLLQIMEENSEQVTWAEPFSQSFALHQTPLNLAPLFANFLDEYQASWVFTSATLSLADDLSYFQQQLGLQGAKGLCLASPFNYTEQALLYVPRYLPDPRAANYTAMLVEALLPVLKASKGRAFLLFTSHRALQQAAKLLREKWPASVLVQGELPKAEMIEQFCQLPQALLLATASFWEGVDVRGEALSCVIIDKLPFASPDDPVLQARSQWWRRQGKDPFNEHQLPQAIISLKQGAGRLIRDITDTGVLVIADPRLIAKRYGEQLLKNLPPMPLSRERQRVIDFFENRE